MGSGAGDDVETAILAALRERADEGLTIFELRHRVPADIDTIESCLEGLKARDLIETERSEGRLTIRPTDAGMQHIDRGDDGSWFERIRQRLQR